MFRKFVVILVVILSLIVSSAEANNRLDRGGTSGSTGTSDLVAGVDYQTPLTAADITALIGQPALATEVNGTFQTKLTNTSDVNARDANVGGKLTGYSLVWSGPRLIGGRNRDNYSSNSDGVVQIATSRIRHPIYVNATNLRLVFGNFYTYTGVNETIGDNNVMIQASIEDSSGYVWPVFFNGRRDCNIMPGGIVISDAVGISVAADSHIFVRTYIDANSGGSPYKYPCSYTLNDSAVATGPDLLGSCGEGTKSNLNYVDSGTVSGGTAYVYSAMMVLGETISTKPSVAVIGDSIAAGCRLYPDGSWESIALAAAKIPYVNVSRGSETLAHWVVSSASNTAYNQSRYRRQLLRYVSTFLIELGTNDLAAGYSATVIANYQTLATEFKNEGKRVYLCTVLPRLASLATHDYGVTYSGQVSSGKTTMEADRILVNASIRNYLGSAQGTYIDDFIDIAAPVEVNDGNTLTQDGGYWKIPLVASDSGTATASTTYTNLFDSAKTWTVVPYYYGIYRSYVLGYTSGNAAGLYRDLKYNAANYTGNTTFSPALPALNDTYQIWPVYTYDGIHPAAAGDAAIAASIAAKVAGMK